MAVFQAQRRISVLTGVGVSQTAPPPNYAGARGASPELALGESAGATIAAEVRSLLQRNVPAEKELQQPREFYERIAELRARQSEGPGPFPTAEEMIREDRDR